MIHPPRLLAAVLLVVSSRAAFAQQPPPKEPLPLWDVQLGAAFVGTSGNSDTSTLGADFSTHRRWPLWRVEAAATAVRTADRGDITAERYLAAFRADRKLTSRIDLSAGERLERDQLAGIDLRSISDVGLKYALLRAPAWTIDSLTSLALNHEEPVDGPQLNHPIGVLQALSKFAFSPTSDTTQRFTYYPDFEESSAYRAEAELTASPW